MKRGDKMPISDIIEFKIISFMHGTLYRIFVDPAKLLKDAGLELGQTVLEVGFGPAFFTLPAASIVGSHGRVYAIDINRVAIEKLKQKIKVRNIENVEVKMVDASNTNLPPSCIDIAFLFGVIHALGDVSSVMQELHRVLKDGGVLSIQKGRWSKERIIAATTQNGLFIFKSSKGRVLRFRKD
jgi:ubiquinone/menaquinone biosynthesis C-methylase UbiE